MTSDLLSSPAPRQIRPPRPVSHISALSPAERLLVFDAIHRALEAHGPGATVTPRSGPDGLRWDISPAPHTILTTGARPDPLLTHLTPHLHHSTHIDILAAFIMRSGVALIEQHLRAALQRGATVRILTGDYLDITQAGALRSLMDLSYECDRGDDDSQIEYPGGLSLRVVEHAQLRRHATTFHPKAWLLRDGPHGIAFVGSSNLSRAALLDGLEWNLGVESRHDPLGFARILDAYDALWLLGQSPSPAWLDAYQARQLARSPSQPTPQPAEDPPPPQPRGSQRAALDALAKTRAAGHARALVVMATGMGKTWLAAFDVANFIQENDIDAPRVLVIAHRIELLRQAARTFRVLFPSWRFAWCVGDRRELDGQLVLASVQKLSRQRSDLVFDYVVIDEVHHANAPSYIDIIERLKFKFLLGLTATPDRADGQDLLSIFNRNVPFTATIRDGIEQGALSPLHYYGLKDTIDYEPLPWRGGRFEPEALEAAAQTVARMERLWRAFEEHAGSRTLVFCCAIAHADFAASWLRGRGWRVACVHSGGGSDDRELALERLERGELEAICVVDLFNEGIDLPSVDRVAMLRPTESPVIFLQQLGRGLRAAPGKSHLTVIDLVGNHRVFLDRLRLLCEAVGQGAATLRAAFSGRVAAPDELAPGCVIELELEAVALLRELWPAESDLAIVRAYRVLAASGRRPTACDLFVRGHNPLALRRQGGWLRFVEDEGGLTRAESAALAQERAWLDALEGWRWRDARSMGALEAWLERAERGMWEGDASLGAAQPPADEAQRVALLGLVREVVDGLCAARASEVVGERVVGCVEGVMLVFEAAVDASLVVRCDDGSAWRLWFEGARCVAARRSGDGATIGALIGALGEGAQVVLERAPEGWWLHAQSDMPRTDVAAGGSSYVLEGQWVEAARAAMSALWARHGGSAVSVEGRQLVFVEQTRTGSLRIKPDGAGERGISLTDLGWVLRAAAYAEERGETVDLALVNRLRYKPGTPKESTRYIDTGWAIKLNSILNRGADDQG